MSLKKISADVRKRFQVIQNRGQSRAEMFFYQSLIDDAEFWQRSEQEPQLVEQHIGFIDGGKAVHRQYIFKNCAYLIKGNYSPEDEKLLVQDDFDSERRKFERLRNKFSLARDTEPRNERTAISEEVRVAVWRRDNGRCVGCGSRDRLEYDHIIPVSRGGSSTVRNIELLCEACNRGKGANIQ